MLVFGMTGVLAMLGLVVDGSYYWVDQRQAQGAADAAALAAAQDLSGSGATSDDTSASSDGTTVAHDNDANLTVLVTAPYQSNVTSAQVVVSKSVRLPFGFRATVKATAVATNDVVRNGSFNATFSASWIEYCATNGITDEGPYASACRSAQPDMGSWTVYSGGVDLNNTSYITAPQTDPTAQSIDMVGSCSYDAPTKVCDNQINGEIYEPLSTVPNDTYTLNFELSENPHGPPASKPLGLFVSSYAPNGACLPCSGGTYGLTYATPIATMDGAAAEESWTPKQYSFTATASTTYLWFESETGCVANGQTAPNDWTAVASDCNNGAAITDIHVTGPLSENLSQ